MRSPSFTLSNTFDRPTQQTAIAQFYEVPKPQVSGFELEWSGSAVKSSAAALQNDRAIPDAGSDSVHPLAGASAARRSS